MGDLDRKKAYATERVTVGSTTTTLTATTYNNVDAGSTSALEMPFGGSFRATAVLVEVITEGLYYTMDGTNPTSSTGHKLGTGDQLVVMGPQKIATFKAIRNTTDCTVQYTYYKE